MMSNLSFLTYLVAFFASHASCAPQRTFDESFYVSSGQTCSVTGGIKGTYLTSLGDIKQSCDNLAFDPGSLSYTIEHREMRCWFKKACSTSDGVPGLCLNKECLSESQQQNWSKDTTCPKSELDVGCYAEPATNTGKSLDKQAFSADSFVVADSSSYFTTTPPPPPTSFQIAQLPPIGFDDSSSSSSSSTRTATEAAVATSPEGEDYLVQNTLGETDYLYPLLLNEQPQVELPSNAGNSAPPIFDAWALPKFVG